MFVCAAAQLAPALLSYSITSAPEQRVFLAGVAANGTRFCVAFMARRGKLDGPGPYDLLFLINLI